VAQIAKMILSAKMQKVVALIVGVGIVLINGQCARSSVMEMAIVFGAQIAVRNVFSTSAFKSEAPVLPFARWILTVGVLLMVVQSAEIQSVSTNGLGVGKDVAQAQNAMVQQMGAVSVKIGNAFKLTHSVMLSVALTQTVQMLMTVVSIVTCNVSFVYPFCLTMEQLAPATMTALAPEMVRQSATCKDTCVFQIYLILLLAVSHVTLNILPHFAE